MCRGVPFVYAYVQSRASDVQLICTLYTIIKNDKTSLGNIHSINKHLYSISIN